MGLTQQGLSERSGVTLPTLRKFEQKGQERILALMI
jgi:transcriptional regulator with XRE-family HTH domain